MIEKYRNKSKLMSFIVTIFISCLLSLIHYITMFLLPFPEWWNWCYILIAILGWRVHARLAKDIAQDASDSDIVLAVVASVIVFTSISLWLLPVYAIIFFAKEGYEKWKYRDFRRAVKQHEKDVNNRLHELGLTKDDYYLSFQKINGHGLLVCDDCGYKQEITPFIHGGMSCVIGRQCPNCHTIFTEYNESQEYHVFGKATEDCICPQCHTIVRKIEENILKNNDYPLVCPNCHKPHIGYYCEYET